MPVNLYDINIADAQLLCGLFAILGHIFPVFLKFKGGKGIATCFGVALSLYFTVSVITLVSFIVIVSLTRYVSLGSIIAVIIFSTLSISLGREQTSLEIIFFIAISFTVLFTHRKNIMKLLRCQENKINFKKK
ncbi:MAG: glycerol-3-phosphate acyltransferase [Solitalea-like symbiont of Acarus siro]